MAKWRWEIDALGRTDNRAIRLGPGGLFFFSGVVMKFHVTNHDRCATVQDSGRDTITLAWI